MNELMEKIKFDDNGLIPAVTQDYKSCEVLILAFMNREALSKTIETGKVHYFSRSRKKMWLKGETSGNFQLVKSILVNCEDNSLLIKVEQVGKACHTGHYSCYFREAVKDELKEIKANKEISNENTIEDKLSILRELYNVISDRKANPKEGSYTNYLFEKGIDKICKKIGEEAAEVIIASKNNSPSEIRYEIADLYYHLYVLMVDRGIKPEDIYDELRKRR